MKDLEHVIYREILRELGQASLEKTEKRRLRGFLQMYKNPSRDGVKKADIQWYPMIA